ncbi:hypothetical protein [Rhizobium halophytocola]|uniref:HAD family hydrolase n=1 Tax=Rhizobium halophytocola TaxID=735519 RepID=A0ABS4DY21_9HYPH|nr:hypothetical protein [Rhizobium halophytocola]MBP1850597.1 hypothetical protein [Rhizobium halophytocola]
MTADGQLADIRLGHRPLLVCDVDDVVLQFVQPFERYLVDRDLELVPRSFRLTGNIVSQRDGTAVEDSAVRSLLDTFYDEQEHWQVPAERAHAMLDGFSAEADVVFLTAMSPRYFDRRRRLLDRLGFSQPLIATEAPKGPLVAQLHGARSLPLAFVDDMVGNLISVGTHVADCLLVHLQPRSAIHRLAPATPPTAERADGWLQADRLIRRHFAVSRPD